MLKKMRQCRLNFADNRYDCEAGIIGEHYATELIVTPPVIMPSEAVYRLCFEPGGLSEIILQTTDGTFSYPLPSAVTATPYCCVTLIGYVGSEQIYKSRMVRLHFSQTADGDADIDPRQPGIVDEVNQNTAARHSHDNKAVLDLLSESDDGNLQFDGKALGGGGGTATAEDVSYTLPDDVQNEFPDIVELESDTVKSGLDVAMYYALAGMFAKYISCNLQSGSGETVSVDLQRILDGFVFPAMFKAHEHDNKSVLDKFDESDGKPTYDGTAIGDGGSTETELFVVNVQAQSEEGEYTITSHDKTYTQIDEAYKAGKQVLVVCTITGEDSTFLLPLIWATETDYEFSIFVGAVMSIFVDTTDKWTISQDYLEASSIMAKISDDALAEPSSLQSILNYKVYPAVEKAHEHSNETVLDHLSDSNGKLLYNGTEAGLKGEKGDKGEPGTPGAPGAPGSDATVTKDNVVAALGYTPKAVSAQVAAGTNITLADNTEYRLENVTTLTLAYPTGNFECWLKLTFAESGNITVTLPADTKYIGSAPDFKNGETWELSFKDKVLAAQKVGEGT